ncbi:MAG: hypothetical protein H6626_02930 [Pseudobdellovibrionaceae bacterium]|nr:MAG: hypothetical protein H6626_02930 [Pseudobdellovibrionaceae bacterium]
MNLSKNDLALMKIVSLGILILCGIFVLESIEKSKHDTSLLEEAKISNSECQEKVKIERKNSFNEGFYRAFQITLSPQFKQNENQKDENR